MTRISRLMAMGALAPVLMWACTETSHSPSTSNGSAPVVRESDPDITVPKTLGKDTFGINVFRDVVAEQKGNVVFSPASLENLLEILKQGARGNTLAALQKAPMGCKGVKSAMKVESADALFIADEMKLKPVSVSDIKRISFKDAASAAAKVNAWSKDKTYGLIPSIVTPDALTGDTRMVALNAVYLNEKWLHPFDKECTFDNGRFHSADGMTDRISMMHQTGDFRYAEGEDWQAIALFYSKQGRAGEPGCFIGILPKGDARKFAASLTPEKYNDIRKALAKANYKETRVTLPKLDVSTQQPIDLNNVLTKNGLVSLFQDCDFSGFADEDLTVDKVLQSCRIIMDEEKTEAAAVSAALIPQNIDFSEPQTIIFDRPFIWAIDDLTTGSAPFFMGLFEKP